MELTGNLKNEATAWLKDFARMVREKDYSDAEQYFDAHTFGFGTILDRYANLEEYHNQQWLQCWGSTKDFEFDYPSLTATVSPDGSVVILGILWSSVGIKIDGTQFPRKGRATHILKRDEASGKLKSIHNHYSRTPQNYPDDF